LTFPYLWFGWLQDCVAVALEGKFPAMFLTMTERMYLAIFVVTPWSPQSPPQRLLMSSKTARAGAGSGEVPGWTRFLRLPACVARRGSFMGCVLAGCRGEAWLKKGLPSSK
jgi:hypothetical protein